MTTSTEHSSATGDLSSETDLPPMPEYIAELLRVVPGQEQVLLAPSDIGEQAGASTPGHCPPWVRHGDVTDVTSFDIDEETFYSPLVHEEPNPLVYPMCTVGYITNSNGKRGSGVLVGPNLLLTAGHVAPWGAANWWMEFTPAFRNGGTPPFGSSYVQTYRGYNTAPEVSGHDYVICKLYQPLGNAVGWMGTTAFGSESAYEARRYVSSGYPGSYGLRPAVELDMGIRDIDNDSPGIELEFARRADLGPGWSGGPLWLPNEGPAVAAVFSGEETDEFDPRRLVFAGGNGMVDLVRFGLANWPV